MPEHNLIQRPDLIRRLQSFFGIRQAHVTPTLATTIAPVVMVADLTKEQLGHGHVPGLPTTPLLCAAHFTIPAVVGQNGRALLHNPIGSNRILRVLACNASTACELFPVYNVTVPLATLALPYCLDGDQKSTPLAPTFPNVGVASQDTVGAVPGQGFMRGSNSLLNLVYLDNPPMILDEGDGFLAYAVTVNQTVEFNVRWLEETKSAG